MDFHENRSCLAKGTRWNILGILHLTPWTQKVSSWESVSVSNIVAKRINKFSWNFHDKSDVRHETILKHDDVIKWKHFPCYWPFVRGIHWSLVNSPHKGQWRGALMFSFICVWINDLANNREAGDLRRHRAHNDVIVMNLGRCYL